MKIIFLGDGDNDTLTGGYIYNRKLAEGMNAENIPFDFYSVTGNDLPEGDVLIVDSLVSESAFPLTSQWKAKYENARIVYLAHLPAEGDTGFEKPDAKGEAQVIGISDIVVTTGEVTHENLKKCYPDTAHVCIEPGTDNLQEKGNWADSLRNMTMSGSIIARKDYLTVIKALAPFRTRAWKLEIFGHKDREPDYLYEVNRAIHQNELHYHILLKGAVDQEKSWRAIQKSDLFLNTSLHETYGMSAEEAVRMKVPTILSDLPVYRQRMNDLPVQWCEPGNDSQLSDIIGSLLLSGKEYISFSRKWKGLKNPALRTWEDVAADWKNMLL